MKLYMIKYTDLYTRRLKTGFFYTELTERSEIERAFRRRYIGEINIISNAECINNETYIGDVGEFYINESNSV